MRDRLSARQREVLRLTAAGLTSIQAGRRLGINPTTVSRHLAEIYKTLGAQDRAHAVALGVWRGDITLADLAAIAGGVADRGTEAVQKPSGGSVGAREGVRAVPELRDGDRAAGAAA